MVMKQEVVHIQETKQDADNKWVKWHLCPRCEALQTGQTEGDEMEANFKKPSLPCLPALGLENSGLWSLVGHSQTRNQQNISYTFEKMITYFLSVFSVCHALSLSHQ